MPTSPSQSVALARRQIELDSAATARFPDLLARKKARLLVSPHGFLRGSAPLFYEILAKRPDLAEGPPGEGWIVGDMHLENVGAYRTDEDHVVFGLNDFDDATVGPLRLDVVRLATSVLLAGRSFHSTGTQAIALTERLLAAYCRAAFEPGATPPAQPAPVTDLLRSAEARSKHDLLDDRAPEAKGKRHFVRGERYLDLPPQVRAEVPALLASYVAALGPRAPGHAAQWTVEDAAFRVAGTGSLGSLRVAVLVRDGQGGDYNLVELKEAKPSSANALLGSPTGAWNTPAERVVLAARSLTAKPVRHLAPVASPTGTTFIARKLCPQEDKLGIDTFHTGPKLEAVVDTIGHVVGVAHARAATVRPPNAAGWSPAEVATIVDAAVELAGIFEGVYLAYARQTGPL